MHPADKIRFKFKGAFCKPNAVKFELIGFSKIPVNLSSGVYVVAIKAGKKTKNVKIVIR